MELISRTLVVKLDCIAGMLLGPRACVAVVSFVPFLPDELCLRCVRISLFLFFTLFNKALKSRVLLAMIGAFVYVNVKAILVFDTLCTYSFPRPSIVQIC